MEMSFRRDTASTSAWLYGELRGEAGEAGGEAGRQAAEKVEWCGQQGGSTGRQSGWPCGAHALPTLGGKQPHLMGSSCTIVTL